MISIITSVYKSEEYLPEFIRRLDFFAQWLKTNHLTFEHIVVANDPSEEEKNFFKKYRHASWFSFVCTPREPLYATWNRGVGLSKGETIGFWNVDDIRYPDAIVECSELINRGADLVYFPFIINRYIKIFSKYFLIHKQTINIRIPEFNELTKSAFLYEMNCGPFFMFTKALYQRVGPFDEQYKIAGDFDWCMRAVKASAKLVKAKGVAGEFRVDGGGLSAGGSMRQIVENNLVFKRSGALDKIRPQDETMASGYDPTMIFFQGKSIKV